MWSTLKQTQARSRHRERLAAMAPSSSSSSSSSDDEMAKMLASVVVTSEALQQDAAKASEVCRQEAAMHAALPLAPPQLRAITHLPDLTATSPIHRPTSGGTHGRCSASWAAEACWGRRPTATPRTLTLTRRAWSWTLCSSRCVRADNALGGWLRAVPAGCPASAPPLQRCNRWLVAP